MKTTSRKRLLISSVAMLLVAMLALGTATFAWFTQDTRSYADQINAKTSKVSSLVLSKQDRTNWQSHIQYGVDGRVMYPASSSNGSQWFYANASDAVQVQLTTHRSRTQRHLAQQQQTMYSLMNLTLKTLVQLRLRMLRLHLHSRAKIVNMLVQLLFLSVSTVLLLQLTVHSVQQVLYLLRQLLLISQSAHSQAIQVILLHHLQNMKFQFQISMQIRLLIMPSMFGLRVRMKTVQMLNQVRRFLISYSMQMVHLQKNNFLFFLNII